MKRIFYIGSLFLALLATSCDNFLDREPLDTEVNDTYWTSETNIRTFAQHLYSDYYTGYGTDYNVFGGYFSGDNYTDDFLSLTGGVHDFPLTATTGTNATSTTWTDSYEDIYMCNTMLEKIPGMSMDDAAKAHWIGIARYFRAMAYSALSKLWGGVPYIDRVMDPNEKDSLYQDRMSYPDLALKILDDYKYALANVRTDDGTRQVNRYIVGAYMSRDLLYAATWLKYHGSTVGPTSQPVSDTEIKALLQGAIDGAQLVMKSGKYAIGTGPNAYNDNFSSDDLSGNKDVIIYREYTDGVQCNALMSYNAAETHTMGDLTENVIESYLCSDGLPIGQSPLYKGAKDPSIKNAFQNRDPRLYQTVVDSLRIWNAGIWSQAESPTGYCTKKFLNEEWYAEGSPYCKNRQSPADAPCIRYAEVLLNYVEARYEISRLGGDAFTQNDLDQSINLLRDRQLSKWGEKPVVLRSMPHVMLAGNSLSVNGTVINDPARDPSVDPILWEIRRERRVELIEEGRRGEDLRRWAKYEYLNSADANGNPSMTELGAYVKQSDYPHILVGADGVPLFNAADPTNPAPAEGYINYRYKQGNKTRVFTPGDLNSERYYLRAVPSSQLVSYKDAGYTLTQNPGWE
ncbi:MAG: RagB/SusD family nutrient uptake outer membrane protein [Tannerella sp.]|jgi:hypothetical protein|nr:RagB/SusD family nutrient uptake outer membrane protein [Tannerella sp.]